jgi:hypothetical protein
MQKVTFRIVFDIKIEEIQVALFADDELFYGLT